MADNVVTAVSSDRHAANGTPTSTATACDSSTPGGTKRARDGTEIADTASSLNDNAGNQQTNRLTGPQSSSVPSGSPGTSEYWRPGGGKSAKVMREYEVLRKKHEKRIARAERQKKPPYTLSDFDGDGDDEDSDIEEILESPPKRSRRFPPDSPNPSNNSVTREVIDVDEDVQTPPKPVLGPAVKAPKDAGSVRQQKQKREVIVIDDDGDEEEEEENVSSDDDNDETWAPTKKEMRNNKRKEKLREAELSRPKKARCAARTEVSNVADLKQSVLRIKKRSNTTREKKREKREKKIEKEKEKEKEKQKPTLIVTFPTPRSLFHRAMENAPRPVREKRAWTAAEKAARHAYRKPKFYGSPGKQAKCHLPDVDQTDLFLDDTDWDSDSTLDEQFEPKSDSIFTKDPRLGHGRDAWIPSLVKLAALLPTDKNFKFDPVEMVLFRMQYMLFDCNLETALNPEKERDRRWRVLGALKEKGFLDNLRIFGVRSQFLTSLIKI